MSSPPRIIFAGTPEFALPALDALAGWQPPIAVYTQPDRPAGRGRKLSASPVKQRALDLGLQVRQPETLRGKVALAALAALKPDVMVVAAYGLILPPEILAAPRIGCINIHASLLPRWRGAAPVQRAIMAGDDKTGISIMQMAEGLDTGDVLLQRETVITPEDTGGSLHDRLASLGAETLMDALPGALEGKLTAAPQDDSLATYAKKLDKGEARLDWREPAWQLSLQIRAMNPWPVCDCGLNGQRLRIWAAQPLDSAHDEVPGTVVGYDRDGIRVACGEGLIAVTELQLPGRRRMSAAEFTAGRNLSGARFTGRTD
ncbi:MAG: methionyl-tRNA formyltransferase [Gammaproteobacteria bacterium]|nr:methionyl-tRNA formyltransferase [Gammaproteobacteria bacterium]